MSSPNREPRGEEQERVVIRDNRKIDPKTGEARKPQATEAAAGAQAPAAGPGPVPAEPVPEGNVPMVEAALLDERTADLQRLQAEYANYRRRAERDRVAAGDLAIGRALTELLPVLDDIDRAEAHGDLTGGLKAVADTFNGVVAKLGLEAFGEVGDPFDPSLHEAVMHDESDAVTVPTCTTVMRKGYRHKDRLLRPAMVGVSDPVASAAPDSEAFTSSDVAGESPTESFGEPTLHGESSETPTPTEAAADNESPDKVDNER
ncbi:MAG TPA: nucleotide exchange factor GrpE [Jatrophihabitans sp.]|nr:nucleotide exchange factor GrpE [Jatrophihabitans sp.]